MKETQKEVELKLRSNMASTESVDRQVIALRVTKEGGTVARTEHEPFDGFVERNVLRTVQRTCKVHPSQSQCQSQIEIRKEPVKEKPLKSAPARIKSSILGLVSGQNVISLQNAAWRER